jgi:micrococcal nuclease
MLIFNNHKQKKRFLFLFLLNFSLLMMTPVALHAHRSGCHRWHSCPSDRDTYTCGDTGHCSQCPDNQFCDARKPRKVPKPSSKAMPQKRFSGRVAGVIDGDTIRVTHDLKSVKVRLYGVDCPDIKQVGGKAARALVRRLAFGRVLLIESKGKDRYKRIIGRVFLLSGNTLSRELVKAGKCWWYEKYAPDDQYLMELEKEAKAEKRDIWAEPDPVPPWEWRKKRR